MIMELIFYASLLSIVVTLLPVPFCVQCPSVFSNRFYICLDNILAGGFETSYSVMMGTTNTDVL